MTKSIAIVVAVAGLLAFAGAAEAALLLSLDARNTAAGQWDDLTGNNSPFLPNSTSITAGLTAPTLTAAGPGTVYRFNGSSDGFASQAADESNFDFDTAAGGVATPFTVVTYFDGDGGDGTLVSKGENQGVPTWMFQPGGANATMIQQPTNSGNRAFTRFLGTNIGNTGWHLAVWHFDGSGDANNVQIFIDGSAASHAASVVLNALSASLLNNHQVHIGGINNEPPANGVNRYTGDIQIVEIYSGTTIDNQLGSGLTPGQYSALRWANLSTIIIPEPATMALLGIGGLMVLRRRRSA